MPYSVEQKILGLKKEGDRGIPEVIIRRFIAADKSSEMEYKLNLIEDEQLRGVYDRFPPAAGTKEGTGKIAGIDIESENVGEIFLSLLGGVTPASQGGTAFKHTFKRTTQAQLPSYTIFMHRGITQKAYPLSVIKSVTFTGAMDGKAKLDADVLFKTEVASAVEFAPAWDEAKPFMFFQTDFQIADVSDIDVRSWNLTIDNQSIIQRVLNQSQDVRNILTPGKLLVSGSFERYFEDEDERDKFLAGTASSLKIVLTGAEIDVGGAKHRLAITLPRIHYSAFPYGELDGLLGAAAAFNCYYKPGGSIKESVQLELTNTVTNYETE